MELTDFFTVTHGSRQTNFSSLSFFISLIFIARLINMPIELGDDLLDAMKNFLESSELSAKPRQDAVTYMMTWQKRIGRSPSNDTV